MAGILGNVSDSRHRADVVMPHVAGMTTTENEIRELEQAWAAAEQAADADALEELSVPESHLHRNAYLQLKWHLSVAGR